MGLGFMHVLLDIITDIITIKKKSYEIDSLSDQEYMFVS